MQASFTRPLPVAASTFEFIPRDSFKRAKQKTPDSAKQALIEGYIAEYESGLPAAGKHSDANIRICSRSQ
jgi:hypothetical protein